MNSTAEDSGVETVRTRYRCHPTYFTNDLKAMTALGRAGLDRNLYLAIAMDQLSETSRPRYRMSVMLEKYRLHGSPARNYRFSPLLREPGVFTDEIEVIKDDLVAHGLVIDGQPSNEQLQEVLDEIPSYSFPGLGERVLIWTPHVRERLARMRASGGKPREPEDPFERDYLTMQLHRFSGDISRTASFIGMERSVLERKLQALGISGAPAKQQ